MLDIKIEYYMPSESGNAVAIDIGGWLKVWFSYSEPVAFWTAATGLVVCSNVWTRTTGKHLNRIQPDAGKRVPHGEFLRQLYEVTAALERGIVYAEATKLMAEVDNAK